mgnify:CR=1 FL=1
MNYSYEVVVSTSHTVFAPLEFSIKLAAGILRDVKIFFPYGCSNLVRCQLWSDLGQIAPQNLDGFYALDGNVASISLYYDLDKTSNQLWLVCWGVSCRYNHTLQVHLDVQGRDEPDNYYLLNRLLDTENTLLDLMRQVF